MRHSPSMHFAGSSQSSLLAQVRAQRGSSRWSGSPLQKTEGYNPHSLTSIFAVHAESSGSDPVIWHWASTQLKMGREPIHNVGSSQVAGATQSASFLHSEPLDGPAFDSRSCITDADESFLMQYPSTSSVSGGHCSGVQPVEWLDA